MERVMKRWRAGQSTVEYLLVLVAVLLVVMVAISGAIKTKIKEQTDNAGAIMDKASIELKAAAGIDDDDDDG